MPDELVQLSLVVRMGIDVRSGLEEGGPGQIGECRPD